jgi:hypothetical protein
MFMLSVFAMLRDILLIFVFGASVGYFFGWRQTRKRWMRKIARIHAE